MQAFDKEVFLSEMQKLGLGVSELQLRQLDAYAAELVEWNKSMNLTGVDDPYGIAVTHFADSMTLLKSAPVDEGARLADIGTGAGFPGLPVKILRPDIALTLIDSLEKRLKFLAAVVDKLGLENVTLLHLRAEDGGRDSSLRESFDIVTARAVAAYNKLCEYCIPYVKKGGYFVALKGPAADDELCSAGNALKVLGTDDANINRFTLSDGSTRGVITVKKVSHTPTIYPRKTAVITKKPL